MSTTLAFRHEGKGKKNPYLSTQPCGAAPFAKRMMSAHQALRDFFHRGAPEACAPPS
jgi:hypothetical protein